MLMMLILLNNLHSMSMGESFAAMPKIPADDELPFRQAKNGSVVCFWPSPEFYHPYYTQKPDHYVCHRIFWRNETHAFTWGDNRTSNPRPDFGYVTTANYLGVVR